MYLSTVVFYRVHTFFKNTRYFFCTSLLVLDYLDYDERPNLHVTYRVFLPGVGLFSLHQLKQLKKIKQAHTCDSRSNILTVRWIDVIGAEFVNRSNELSIAPGWQTDVISISVIYLCTYSALHVTQSVMAIYRWCYSTHIDNNN